MMDRYLGGSTFGSVYVPVMPARGDALHLLNQVSLGCKPWGVTFESSLPRLTSLAADHPFRKALRRRLMSEGCRFIVAMSEFARQLFLDSLTEVEREQIMWKLFVVPPYQACTGAQPLTPPVGSESLRLIFVGRDFFRKGGEALLRATEMAGERLNFRSTIISSVRGNDYATRCVQPHEVANVRRRLAANSRIDWYLEIPNMRVIELLKRCHIGVLPTMADTYGYSLLEAMSVGLPIVGTNVQAGSEIATPEVGWRLDLDILPSRYWVHVDSRSEKGYRQAIEILATGIVKIVESVRDTPSVLVPLSAQALQRVQDVYGSFRSAQLLKVYERTLV